MRDNRFDNYSNDQNSNSASTPNRVENYRNMLGRITTKTNVVIAAIVALFAGLSQLADVTIPFLKKARDIRAAFCDATSSKICVTTEIEKINGAGWDRERLTQLAIEPNVGDGTRDEAVRRISVLDAARASYESSKNDVEKLKLFIKTTCPDCPCKSIASDRLKALTDPGFVDKVKDMLPSFLQPSNSC
jgi:hypothetical protein